MTKDSAAPLCEGKDWDLIRSHPCYGEHQPGCDCAFLDQVAAPSPPQEAVIPTENPELLPCPFCGGDAEIIHLDDGENAGGSCVCCTKCQASGNVEFGFKENFVSNWNRRTPPQEAVIPTGGAGEGEVSSLVKYLRCEAAKNKAKRKEVQHGAHFVTRARKLNRAADLIEQLTGNATSSACGIAPLGDEPEPSITPTRGEAEPVAWLYTEHRWKDGPRHRLSIKRQAISDEDLNEFEISETPLYASQPHAPDSWRPNAQAIARIIAGEDAWALIGKSNTANQTCEDAAEKAEQILALQPKGEER